MNQNSTSMASIFYHNGGPQGPIREGQHPHQTMNPTSDPHQIEGSQYRHPQHVHQTFNPALTPGTSSNGQRTARIPSSVEAAGLQSRSSQQYSAEHPRLQSSASTSPAHASSPPHPPYPYPSHSPTNTSNLRSPLHFQYGSPTLPTPPSSANQLRSSVGSLPAPPPNPGPRHQNSFPQQTSGPQPPPPPQRRATIHAPPSLNSIVYTQIAPAGSSTSNHGPNLAPASFNQHPPPPAPRRNEPPTPTSQHEGAQQLPHPSNQVPTTSSDVDSMIQRGTEMALEPVRRGFEEVWSITVNNVRLAMNKMNANFTRLATAERQKSIQLTSIIAELEAKLRATLDQPRAATIENAEMRKENEGLSRGIADLSRVNEDLSSRHGDLSKKRTELLQENADLKKENADLKEGMNKVVGILNACKNEFSKLHAEKEKIEVENKVLRDLQQGRNDINTVLSTVSEQVAREVETKMATMLDEMQEQRVMMIQAEQKHEETVKQLQQAKGEVLGSPSIARPPSSTPSQPQSLSRSTPCTPDHRQTHSRRPSSPHLLSGTPSIKRLSGSSPAYSTTSTHVPHSMSPPQWKHATSDDGTRPTSRHQTRDLMDTHRSSATPDPRGQRSPVLPDAREPSTSMDDLSSSSPLEPPRKRNRSEYEADEEEDQLPDRKIKAEQLSDSESTPSRPRSVQVDRSRQPTPSTGPPPRTPIHDSRAMDVDTMIRIKNEEVNKVQDHEDGEVVEKPESLRPPPPPTRSASNTSNFQSISPVRTNHTGRPHPISSAPLPRISTTSSTLPSKQPPIVKPKVLGIKHMDLLYLTENGSMTCRMCLTRAREMSEEQRKTHSFSVKRFPGNAAWSDLIGHCKSEHPKACADLEKMGPSQIAEMKQRMASTSSSKR